MVVISGGFGSTQRQPQFSGFEVIGTFNPAAVEFNDEVAMMIRVVERPTETRAGYIVLPYWDHDLGAIAVDWRSLEEVELIDPRIVRIKATGHIRLTFISWLLPAFSRDGVSIDRFGEHPMLPSTRYETFGVEDARLAKLDDRYYLTYVAVSPHGISTALASTADFQSSVVTPEFAGSRNRNSQNRLAGRRSNILLSGNGRSIALNGCGGPQAVPNLINSRRAIRGSFTESW